MIEFGIIQRVIGRIRRSSISVIISANAVHAVLHLVIVFLNGSRRIRMYQVEFLSRIFIVVYVGAIAVLFRFVVMMLNLSVVEEDVDNTEERRVITVLMIRVSSGTLRLQNEVNQVWLEKVDWHHSIDPMSSIEAIGQVRYTYGVIYVRRAGFVLLVALIGAITLTLQVRSASGISEDGKNKRLRRKRQRPNEQSARRDEVML